MHVVYVSLVDDSTRGSASVNARFAIIDQEVLVGHATQVQRVR